MVGYQDKYNCGDAKLSDALAQCKIMLICPYGSEHLICSELSLNALTAFLVAGKNFETDTLFTIQLETR